MGKIPDNSEFIQLKGVTTVTATPSDVTLDNIKLNIKRPHLRLHKLPEYKLVKGHDTPICLVGGGPSVKSQINKIRKFKTIVACGSVNDWLMEQGIIPTYTAVCDPDPVCAKYLTKTHSETKYLIASGCDAAVFDALEGRQIVLWHCHSDEMHQQLVELEEDYQGIGGGCTVGLRALSIAVMMGYTNIHLFGYDSCFSKEDHHAYNFATKEEQIGDTFYIKVGKVDEGKPAKGARAYLCAGYQVAQADHFKQFYMNYGKYFIPTFHGRGMLADYYKLIKAERESLQ